MTYYNRRAKSYEKVYEKPERQSDLSLLRTELKNRLKDRDVLEIACGTGYWTKNIAQTARSIVGVDQSEEMLAIARNKNISNAQFIKDDAYALAKVSKELSAGFAGFWWSHIPKNKIREFLSTLRSNLAPNSRVIFIDNNYVEGSSTPITRADSAGNTYQTRLLEDNSSYEIMKNFPNEQELRQALDGFASEIEMVNLQYYWLLQYKSHPMD